MMIFTRESARRPFSLNRGLVARAARQVGAHAQRQRPGDRGGPELPAVVSAHVRQTELPDRHSEQLVEHLAALLPAVAVSYAVRHPSLERPQLDEAGARLLAEDPPGLAEAR